MNPVIYNEFKNLLDKLNKEKDDIQNQISDNTLQIIEAQSYTKKILDKEEEDFKVFSPRKIEDIYKDELEKSNVKQSDYEKRNQVLISRREELDSMLFVLESVWEEINLVSEPDNDESEYIEIEEKEQVEEEVVENRNVIDESTEKVIKDTVNKINHIAHKINLSTKIIHQDPMRVKMELDTINQNIKKVIDNLCEVIDE